MEPETNTSRDTSQEEKDRSKLYELTIQRIRYTYEIHLIEQSIDEIEELLKHEESVITDKHFVLKKMLADYTIELRGTKAELEVTEEEINSFEE